MKCIHTLFVFLLLTCLANAAPVEWQKCTKASSWALNAQARMMNIFSPNMSDSKAASYIQWMKSRGCNTAHVFISNEGNGEHSGYSIYGPKWDWTIDSKYYNLMLSRIQILRKQGFAVVIWLFADDSPRFNSLAAKNFEKYIIDCKNLGFFKEASIVVVGLELNEYYGLSDVVRLISATKKHYNGKIGTHQTSGRYEYSKYANILFYQVDPGKSASWIKAETIRVKKASGGKPLVMFELERNPAREKCLAAFSGAAFSVGNW